jgi:hypothetical protein
MTHSIFFRRPLALAALCAISAPTGLPAQDRGNFAENATARYEEPREEVLTGITHVDIDPGANGGIQVRGWDRNDVRIRARVGAFASSEEAARQVVSAIHLSTVGGVVRAEAPDLDKGAPWWTWWVAFDVDLPRDMNLVLKARNGSITMNDFRGRADFETTNGAIWLENVGGNLKGRTRNGGVHIFLDGPRWEGAGLDVETHNGSVNLLIPDSYAGSIEVGSRRGRLVTDFPNLQRRQDGDINRIQLGAGGALIRAVTTNGRLVVRRR